MVVEESITIIAPLAQVWKTFTDLACWADWNTVMKDPRPGNAPIKKGAAFRFCMRPFIFPIYIETLIEEVVIKERVVWSGSKFGIFARHEFVFRELENKVIVRSRESFQGMHLAMMPLFFAEKKIREMTKSLLGDLKRASENR